MTAPAVGEYVRIDQTFPVYQYHNGELIGTYQYPAGEIAQVVQQEEDHSRVVFVHMHKSAIYRFPNENLTRVRKKETVEWIEIDEGN